MGHSGFDSQTDKRIFKPGYLLACLLASFLFSGCIYEPVDHGPPVYGRYYPHYYDYYYYPSAHVYFQFTTGFYFYLHGGHWIRARVLPPYIVIDPYDRVRIKVDSDKPYTRFEEHRSRFKPRPPYRATERKNRSLKEKDANRDWYHEYEREKKKSDKTRKDKDRKDKDRKDKDRKDKDRKDKDRKDKDRKDKDWNKY